MGRVIPQHSYDHTRRSQRDIVVYNDIELRNVLGNVKRGSRVVIASQIFVSRSVEINIVEAPNGTNSQQAVTITGFGGGRLEPKSGSTPFDLFKVGGDSPTKTASNSSYLFIQDLYIKGFDAVILNKESASNYILTSVNVQRCVIEECEKVFSREGGGASQNLFLQESVISDNIIISTVTIQTVFSDIYINLVRCEMYANTEKIRGGTGYPPATVSINGIFSETNMTDNTLLGSVDIFLFEGSMSGNSIGGNLTVKGDPATVGMKDSPRLFGNRVAQLLTVGPDIKGLQLTNNFIDEIFIDPTSESLVIVGNVVGNLTYPAVMLNTECCIVRDNIAYDAFPLAESLSTDIIGPGRIAYGGEYLGETVIDSPINTWVRNVTADATLGVWEDLTNINNISQRSEVTFYIPCGKTCLIRLHSHIICSSALAEKVNIRLVDFTSGVAVPLSTTMNTVQEINYEAVLKQPVMFEWRFNGNYLGSPFVAGQEVTLGFQVQTEVPATSGITFVAGTSLAWGNFGPMTIAAEGIGSKHLFITADGPPPLKGKPPPKGKV